MPTLPTVIAVLSRKGGVGKTSIALTAAMQLAARDKKVAFIDMDTLGCHLSQVLPTTRDCKTVGDDWRFVPEAEEREGLFSQTYDLRPWFSWRFPARRRGYSDPKFSEIESHLVISSLCKGRSEPCSEAFSRVEKRLGLFLLPCYISEMNVINDLILRSEGQERFRNVLNRFVAELGEQGYEYLVIDNSPGLNFLGANVMAWAMEWGYERPGQVHLWIVSIPPWWEQGLLLYETSLYPHLFGKSHTTLVLNRARQPWLGLRGLFDIGKSAPLPDKEKLRDQVCKPVFSIPLGIAHNIANDPKSWERYVPDRLQVAVLGTDSGVESAMVRHAEQEGAQQETDDTTTSPVLMFHRQASKFLAEFLIPALEATTGPAVDATKEKTTFHQNVRTALIDPLLDANKSRTSPVPEEPPSGRTRGHGVPSA